MAKQKPKFATQIVTKLSADKDPTLAEIIDLYGLEQGYALWQRGVDMDEIRELKRLIARFGLPDKAGKPIVPQNADAETLNLKADILALQAKFTRLQADTATLRAVLPRNKFI